MNIGIKIKKIRTENGITQTELAKVLGVGKTTISNYETGYSTPDASILKRLSDYFNVSTDFFLDRINQSDNSPKKLQEYNDFIENVKIQFMDASEKDRDAIYRKISELYWDAKEKQNQSDK